MGYETVKRVPYLRSYGRAMTHMTQTKPIRGRSPELIPLGDRRDADTYSIRLATNGEDIECVLYKTPVVTFKKNGDVVIWTNGYNTVSTNQFINQVLDIPANSSQRNTIVTIGPNKYVITSNQRLTIRANDEVPPRAGRWTVMDAQVTKGCVFNRTKANSVRAQYKEFTGYVRSMIKLRKEELTSYGRTYEAIRIHAAEVALAFPLKLGYNPNTFDVEQWNFLYDKTGLNYDERVSAFRELVLSGDTEKLHKAFLVVAAVNANKNWGAIRVHDDGMVLRPKPIIEMADEILMKFHAEEVLDVIELPQGKLPNPKYASWLAYPQD